MIETAQATRSVVLERVMPHPPEKVWRALTEVPLLDEWLMKSDFQAVAHHKFNFRAPSSPGWNGIVDCEVMTIEPFERLVYTWNAGGQQAKNGLKSVVTWTLTPVEGGTRVRMEQSGFRPTETHAYNGASFGWTRFVDGLERVLERLT